MLPPHLLRSAACIAIATCKLYEHNAEPAPIILSVTSSLFISMTVAIMLHGGQLTYEEEPSNSYVVRSGLCTIQISYLFEG
jgi:hypothetical protein